MSPKEGFLHLYMDIDEPSHTPMAVHAFLQGKSVHPDGRPSLITSRSPGKTDP